MTAWRRVLSCFVRSPGAGQTLSLYKRHHLTSVSLSVTISLRIKSRPAKDAVRVMPGGRGRVRCPRAKPHQLCSRAVRASCLTALRPVCEVRRWNWEGKPSHEAWPGSHQGTTHPLGRAVVERRQASAPASGGRRKPPYPWRDPRAACVRGLTTVRLPAFRFPLFAGSEPQRTAPQHLGMARSGLDGFEFCHRSPSPQAGGGKHIGCLTSPACELARKYARENGSHFSARVCSRPLTRPRSASPPLGHPLPPGERGRNRIAV